MYIRYVCQICILDMYIRYCILDICILDMYIRYVYQYVYQMYIRYALYLYIQVDIRKPKYTNGTTIFSLQKYFKCQEGNNHWTLAKCRSRLTSIAPSSNSPCPSSSSPWPLSFAPPSSSLSSMKPTIQKYCKKSIELNISK